MNFDELLRILGPGATPPLLLFITLLYGRKIVFGWQYEELVKDRDEWKAVALHGLKNAESSVETAQAVIEKVKGG